MSRTQQQGIEYFPLAVDFFSDKKIKILKARYGADGLAIYLYLLCTIYREGYYTKVDNDFKFIISDELNIRSETVEQVITYLLDRSMFDKQVFQSAEVLTSHGIQQRWQLAVKARAAKTPIKVENYWLLSKEETLPCIKPTIFEDSSEKKDDSSEKKDDISRNYTQSKVKKSKVNNISYLSYLSEDLREFLNSHPDIVIDNCSTADLNLIDYQILSDEIEKSTYLREQAKTLSWLARNYNKIATGFYRDRKKPTVREKPVRSVLAGMKELFAEAMEEDLKNGRIKED